jgi:hypothetical protein
MSRNRTRSSIESLSRSLFADAFCVERAQRTAIAAVAKQGTRCQP